MRFKVFKDEDHKISEWDGGKTKELAIFPETAEYAERNFIWRLSSATIEREEARFSELPDYDRVIMVLEGEVVLSYENQRVARLQRLEQDRFDGGWKTTGFGKITDYNLMVRKGNEGYLDLIFPGKESRSCNSTEESRKKRSTHALYCLEGYAVIAFGEKNCILKTGEQMVIEGGYGEAVEYSVMGEGTLIRAQIFYGEDAEEEEPEIIPHEKATFDDFKACIYLANVQFRWAKHFVKSLRTTWFDEELSRAIRKVESFYMTTLAFVAGLAALVALAASGIVSQAVCAGLAVAWALFDCLVVSPAIYMIFVPKPVRKHIKALDSLTPYERRIRESEEGHDSRAEKIIKRYGGRESNFRN